MELFIFIPRVLKADGWMETELERTRRKEEGRKKGRRRSNFFVPRVLSNLINSRGLYIRGAINPWRFNSGS